MKTIIVVLFVCCFGSNIFGQARYEDVIYFQNGTTIRGMIIEQIPNKTIKIMTKDEKLREFNFGEIEKITREGLDVEKKKNRLDDSGLKKRGFINLTELVYGVGIGEVSLDINNARRNEDYSFGFRSVNGYQFNRHFSLGIGLGIDRYRFATVLPVTVDVRYSILQGKFSPVVVLNGGSSVGLDGLRYGLLLNPQIGIKAHIAKNMAYLFNIGYRIQRQQYDYFDQVYFYNSSSKVDFGFITFSTGFTF